MYINGISGYLSKYEGTEVDAAVERVQGLDSELATKVSIATTVNGFPLDDDVVLSAADVGALPANTTYGKSLKWENNILALYDQQGRSLSNAYLEISKWGKIIGTLSDQTDLQDALNSKQPMITPSAMLNSDLVDDVSASHKFATAAQLSQIATNTSNIAINAANISTNTSSINTINGKIPSQASATNQLADKNFVNSSIATNTSNFIGTFNSLEELEAYSGPLTNNDYGFVISEDEDGNTIYNRYKYNSTNGEWLFEYALNNSSFTAAQWDSINSGITSDGVTQISTNQDDISAINSTLEGFGDIVTYNADAFATAEQGELAETALQSIDSPMIISALGYTPYNAANPDGYISGIDSTMVVNALGYTPYDSANPDGFITGINSGDVTTALGYTPYNATNPDGYISGIDSTMVVNALGYTPYDSTNPNGYISSASVSTLDDVSLNNLENGQSLIYDSTDQMWKNSAAVSLSWGNITGTLSNQTDLQVALNGKQDTISGAASTIVSNNLVGGRVLVSNDSGKVTVSSITSTKLGYLSDVTSNIQVQLNGKLSSASIGTLTDVNLTNLADGEYLRYDSSTDKWVNTTATVSTSLATLTDVNISNPSQGQNLVYDAINAKWINSSSSATVGWGGITGNINDQTDLKNALNSKASVTFRNWSVS